RFVELELEREETERPSDAETPAAERVVTVIVRAVIMMALVMATAAPWASAAEMTAKMRAVGVLSAAPRTYRRPPRFPPRDHTGIHIHDLDLRLAGAISLPTGQRAGDMPRASPPNLASSGRLSSDRATRRATSSRYVAATSRGGAPRAFPRSG